MKNFISLFLIFVIISCKNGNTDSEDEADLFNVSYSDYKEIDILKDYAKVSDTAYVKSGFENTHRITQLEKNGSRLILFAKVTIDPDQYEETYNVIDTLKINNLLRDQKITIGYCEAGNYLMEEIIAIVEKTDRDTIQNIVKTWRANDESNKIESIENSEILFCLNAG